MSDPVKEALQSLLNLYTELPPFTHWATKGHQDDHRQQIENAYLQFKGHVEGLPDMKEKKAALILLPSSVHSSIGNAGGRRDNTYDNAVRAFRAVAKAWGVTCTMPQYQHTNGYKVDNNFFAMVRTGQLSEKYKKKFQQMAKKVTKKAFEAALKARMSS